MLNTRIEPTIHFQPHFVSSYTMVTEDGKLTSTIQGNHTPL